jgi:hypothetical protein
MLQNHFSDNQYRAPSAMQVAMRANEMEKKWRLERGLEHADTESDRYGESRVPWLFKAVQWLKRITFSDEKIISRAAAEQRPMKIEISCVDC